jgi:3-hydroxyacyl-CoA dehydrogenase/enoyl-CoA hydratase/carnithine racemase
LVFGVVALSGRAEPFAPTALQHLDTILDDAEQRSLDALLVVGAGSFQYDVDIPWAQLPDRHAAYDYFDLAHRVLRRFSDIGWPTFACLDGPATGGGLELALHCDYRTVAAENAGLSLPQCLLGLVPGWGGCYLLPHLTGAKTAVDLIVRNALGNAKQTAPERAAALGLVDVVLPAESFVDASLAWAAEVLAGDVAVQRAEVDRGDAWDEAVNRARTWVESRVHGAAPAAYRALDLIALAKTATRDDGFAAESDAAADLVMTEQMRAAAYAYDLTRSRASTAQPDSVNVPIRSVGVVGAGMMAGQLAALVLRTLDVPVVVAHRNDAGVERVTAVVDKVLDQQVRSNALSPERAGQLRERFTATADRNRLAEADIVLEAVLEDADIKGRVLCDIAEVVSSTCVIATGTSSLSVTDLAGAIPRPQRVIGLHFFNPVDLLPLLEVVHTELTDEATRATADAFGRRLGKVIIEAADRPAFVFNRLILRFFGQVLRYAEEGTPLPEAEAALEPLGLPMAPTQMITFTGLPLITMVTERLHEVFPDRFPAPASLRAIVDAGKTGFYIHQGKERIVDPEVYALAVRPETLVVRTPEEVLDGALTALAEEIGLLLDDGVVDDPRDVDLAMLVGGNFPLHLGGITPYLDREGYSERVTGRRFLPRGVASPS